MGQRDRGGAVVLVAAADALAHGLQAEQAAGGEAADRDDQQRSDQVELPIAPEGAELLLAVGAARALFMSGRRLISGRQALGVEFDMRNALYAKLLKLSFGFYDRHQTGQLLSRATVDLQTVRFFLGYGLIFFFQNVMTIIGATVLMFAVNWRLALVATAVTDTTVRAFWKKKISP